MIFHMAGVLTGTHTAESVSWKDGRLQGPPDLVQEIESRAMGLEGHPIGPEGGPYTETNHLSSAISAGIIMAMGFKTHTIVLSGDVPEREPLEYGEVG